MVWTGIKVKWNFNSLHPKVCNIKYGKIQAKLTGQKTLEVRLSMPLAIAHIPSGHNHKFTCRLTVPLSTPLPRPILAHNEILINSITKENTLECTTKHQWQQALSIGDCHSNDVEWCWKMLRHPRHLTITKNAASIAIPIPTPIPYFYSDSDSKSQSEFDFDVQ